ncbi:MAG: peptidase M22 [Clostridia bacterium]|nr:peptidase M22 [Clostridia bacterium]
MRYFLGIDTSNYRTSAAVCDEDGNVVKNVRRLLPVMEGELGLRQSDALFLHTKALPQIMAEIGAYPFAAVGFSARPRDVEGSYMPCFLAGESVASGIAYALGVPLYPFSHQAGHIKAAAYSCKDKAVSEGKSFFDLTEGEAKGRFLTFHLSGGTTEALLYDKGEVTLLGKTLDINAGQVIDRVGVMLGLPFPSGEYLEALASEMPTAKGVKISVRGYDCNMAGAENVARKLLENGKSKEEIAAFALDFVIKTIDKISENVTKDNPSLPILYAGGVASCKRMKAFFEKKYACAFATPQFSGDNAAGTALLAREKFLA